MILMEEMLYYGPQPRKLKGQAPVIVEGALQSGMTVCRQHLTCIYSFFI